MKRRWFLIILFVAVLAVVLTVVFINLFKDRTTTDLSNQVCEVVDGGYLDQDNDDYKEIQSYLSKMSTELASLEETKDKSFEATNYANMYESASVFAGFVNHNLEFSTYNDIFRRNKKAIKNDLQNAQKTAKTLAENIRQNKSYVEGSQFWTINTWNTYAQDLHQVMSLTLDAYDRLIDVYVESVDTKFYNNDFVEVVFNRVDDLLKDVKDNISTDQNCGKTLLSFVEDYLVLDYYENYVYDFDLHPAIKSLKENGKESKFWDCFVEGYTRLLAEKNLH